MSTYSWSYKTASHRQPPLRKISARKEGPINASDELSSQARQSAESSSTSTKQTETAKRLNRKAKIYVGNLNKKTNEASLAYYFSVFGDIDDVKLIRDHDTKESRGFAFVTFEKIESAEKAKKWCAFNYPTLDDSSITVASAERRLPKVKAACHTEYAAPRDPSQTLFWEYKWHDAPAAEVYGPYETSLMLGWKNQGYFDAGCWVRQVLHQTHPVEVAKEESCEQTPSKKLKLVLDYPDSDEGEQSEGNVDNEDESGAQSRLHGIGQSGEVEGAERLLARKEGQCIRSETDENGEIKRAEEEGKREGDEREEGFEEIVRNTVGEDGKENEDQVITPGKDDRKQNTTETGGNDDGEQKYRPCQDHHDDNDETVTETKFLENSSVGMNNKGNSGENMAEDMENMKKMESSSSDEEDMKDSCDDITTEFVPISQIDFDFFP